MSIPIILGAMLLASGATDVVAQVAPQAPSAKVPPGSVSLTPTQTTVVHGTPPDLTGRWLILFDLEAKAVKSTLPFFVEIRSQDGKPEVVEHLVKLPPQLTAELDKHNAAGTKWEPTAADLTLIGEQWTDLPKNENGVAQVTNDIWEPTALDEAERQSPEMKDALWVIRQTYRFTPGGQRPVTQVSLFVGTTREGSGWRGTGALAQVAAAPFPLPIKLDGTFRMLRVEAPEKRPGLLARLLDAFKGCRR
jgi:hypothetical protein